MKKLMILAVSCMTACGFLDENPKTTLMDNSVFNDEVSLEACIYGAMKPFGGSGMYLHEFLEFSQVGSCLSYFPNRQGVGVKNNDEQWYGSYHFTMTSTSLTNNSIYRNHYVIISRCNRILEGLQTSPVDADYRLEIEAEARFIRAVAYFCLVRFYGDVPLLLNSYATDSKDRRRSNYCKVYGHIIDNLEFAEAYMRSPERVNEVTPGKGRPNRWAATAFKSSVYLHIGSLLSSPDDQWFDAEKEGRSPDFSALGIHTEADAWEKSYDAAMHVINNGPYRLEPDFSHLFRWSEASDFHNEEQIFVLNSTVEMNQGQICLRTLPEFPEGTANFIKENKNFGRWRPNRFFFQRWCSAYGGEKGDGPDNKDIYVSCRDPRLDASLIYTRTRRQDTGETYRIYPDNSRVQTSDYRYAWPYYRKYLNPEYDNNCGTFNYYFMRLAEVYLIAAEAKASLCVGPSDADGIEACRLVETLHARARGELSPDAVKSDQPKWETDRFSSKEELIDAIMWERAFELCAEGHDWFDTHRRGANWFKDHYIRPFNRSLDEVEQDKVRAWYTTNRSDCHYPEDILSIRQGLLFAFPNDELIYNSALTADDQNDFYWR